MNTLDCAWPGIVFAPICHGYVACIYLYRHLRSCVGLWKALARMVSWNTRSWNVATDFGSRVSICKKEHSRSKIGFDVSIWWSRWALRPLEIRVDFFSILWRTRISKKIGRSVNSVCVWLDAAIWIAVLTRLSWKCKNVNSRSVEVNAYGLHTVWQLWHCFWHSSTV